MAVKKIVLGHLESDGRLITVDTSFKEKLLPLIQKYWDTPGELYSLILAYVSEGFANHLRPAASRLLEIDSIRERAVTIYGIVLKEAGALEEAEKHFLEAIDQFGRQGVFLSNLSEVYELQDQVELAQKLLTESLRLAPNIERSVSRRREFLEKEGRGQDFWRELEVLGQQANGCYPNLLLAEKKIQEGLIQEGIRHFEKAFFTGIAGPLEMSALISNLGPLELEHDIVRIGLPAFQIKVHGIRNGINLLEALRRSKNPVAGLDLLQRLEPFMKSEYSKYYSYYKREFGSE